MVTHITSGKYDIKLETNEELIKKIKSIKEFEKIQEELSLDPNVPQCCKPITRRI